MAQYASVGRDQSVGVDQVAAHYRSRANYAERSVEIIGKRETEIGRRRKETSGVERKGVEGARREESRRIQVLATCELKEGTDCCHCEIKKGEKSQNYQKCDCFE